MPLEFDRCNLRPGDHYNALLEIKGIVLAATD